MHDNLPRVQRSTYGTWIVTLNGAGVDEDTSKARCEAVAGFLNRQRAYGFNPVLTAFVNEFAKGSRS